MILEIATLIVKPKLTNQFEEDFKVASKYIRAIDGYIEHNLQKCLEQSNKYMLLRWRTMIGILIFTKTWFRDSCLRRNGVLLLLKIPNYVLPFNTSKVGGTRESHQRF